MTEILVIGGGISGLIAACNLKYKNPKLNITIIEKNNKLGGRLYQEEIQIDTIKAVINNGPSWYLMPDLINKVYKEIGIYDNKNIEMYKLKKLNPQYKFITIVDYINHTYNVPSNYNDIKNVIYRLNPKNIGTFTHFMRFNYYLYNSLYDILIKPNLSIFEYIDFQTPYNLYILLNLNFFSSYRMFINKTVSNKFIRKFMEWPCLFIGSSPNKVSALFTFLTYSMIMYGTYIPTKKGMIEIVEVLEKYAEILGVNILKSVEVTNINMIDNKISSVNINSNISEKEIKCDYIVNSSDYCFFESLLTDKFKSYPQEYWDKQILCPSCLIFNVIIDTKLKNLEFHNLFFDKDQDNHIDTIYNTDIFPGEPQFYVNITTKLFDEISDKNYENLFILVPTNLHKILLPNEIDYIYKNIIERITKFTNLDIEKHVVYKKIFQDKDFNSRFNASGNNAWGLGCDLTQIGLFRPRIQSLYIANLYHCGQMTSPGPGIPTCMISGLNSSNLLLKNTKIKKQKFKRKFVDKVSRLINTFLIFIISLGIQNISIIYQCMIKEFKYLFTPPSS